MSASTMDFKSQDFYEFPLNNRQILSEKYHIFQYFETVLFFSQGAGCIKLERAICSLTMIQTLDFVQLFANAAERLQLCSAHMIASGVFCSI